MEQPAHKSSSLAELLQWDTAAYGPSNLWERRHHVVLASFRRLAKRLDWILDQERLRSLVAAVPQPLLKEVLLRTGLAEQVIGSKRGEERRTLDLLARELAFEGVSPASYEGEWNLAQTHQLIECSAVRKATRLEPFSIDLVHCGPLLEANTEGNRIFSGPFVPFSERERARIETTLRTALEVIDAVPSPTKQYVFDCVQVIFVRKFGDGTETHSNSRTGRIGWINIGNPHLPEFTVARCVEMILHEALHHYLSLLEYTAPLMPEDYPESEALITPPWTGRDLTERNLCHATLVWFGLARFFRRFGGDGRFEGRGVDRLDFYEAGFQQRPLIQNFSSPDQLSPMFSDALHEIEGLLDSWFATAQET